LKKSALPPEIDPSVFTVGLPGRADFPQSQSFGVGGVRDRTAHRSNAGLVPKVSKATKPMHALRKLYGSALADRRLLAARPIEKVELLFAREAVAALNEDGLAAKSQKGSQRG
jgi:hypothetical protein